MSLAIVIILLIGGLLFAGWLTRFYRNIERQARRNRAIPRHPYPIKPPPSFNSGTLKKIDHEAIARQKEAWARRRQSNNTRPSPTIRREAWKKPSASETELERMVGSKVAARLILGVQSTNPGKTREWCSDKALYDLKRDRSRL